jgi:hypothetical protein
MTVVMDLAKNVFPADGVDENENGAQGYTARRKRTSK